MSTRKAPCRPGMRESQGVNGDTGAQHRDAMTGCANVAGFARRSCRTAGDFRGQANGSSQFRGRGNTKHLCSAPSIMQSLRARICTGGTHAQQVRLGSAQAADPPPLSLDTQAQAAAACCHLA